uniref:hypothetical protein n=1 Tax=Ndongobacter massiliensis TaxID=1871025 RepID=UPI000930D031|nr:hypothetical protein [Ndongobacter massiliensis]
MKKQVLSAMILSLAVGLCACGTKKQSALQESIPSVSVEKNKPKAVAKIAGSEKAQKTLEKDKRRGTKAAAKKGKEESQSISEPSLEEKESVVSMPEEAPKTSVEIVQPVESQVAPESEVVSEVESQASVSQEGATSTVYIEEPEPPADAPYYYAVEESCGVYKFTNQAEAESWVENIFYSKQIQREDGLWVDDPDNLFIKNGWIGYWVDNYNFSDGTTLTKIEFY